MKSASELLSPEDEQSRKLSEASQQQQIALEKLLEALALLDDPPPPDQNQNQDSSQQPQPQEQEQPQDSQQQNMNAEQMLQAIREREANRRQEKKPSNAMSTGSVEKDW